MYYWPNYIINSLLFASYSFKDSQTQTLNSFLMKYAQKSLDLIIYPLYSFSNKVKNKFEAARWLNGCMEFHECAPPISVLQHTTKNSGESEKSYPTIRHFCQGNWLGKGMLLDFLSINPAQQILIVNCVNITDRPDLVLFIHRAHS